MKVAKKDVASILNASLSQVKIKAKVSQYLQCKMDNFIQFIKDNGLSIVIVIVGIFIIKTTRSDIGLIIGSVNVLVFGGLTLKALIQYLKK